MEKNFSLNVSDSSVLTDTRIFDFIVVGHTSVRQNQMFGCCIAQYRLLYVQHLWHAHQQVTIFEFPVIHKVGNVGIFVLPKFEKKLNIGLSHIYFILIYAISFSLY